MNMPLTERQIAGIVWTESGGIRPTEHPPRPSGGSGGQARAGGASPPETDYSTHVRDHRLAIAIIVCNRERQTGYPVNDGQGTATESYPDPDPPTNPEEAAAWRQCQEVAREAFQLTQICPMDSELRMNGAQGYHHRWDGQRVTRTWLGHALYESIGPAWDRRRLIPQPRRRLPTGGFEDQPPLHGPLRVWLDTYLDAAKCAREMRRAESHPQGELAPPATSTRQALRRQSGRVH
jgi:hypothetical protein